MAASETASDSPRPDATWDEHYRTPFAPLLEGVTFVSNSDPSGLAAAVSGQTAAIIVEPLQGEGGVYVPDDDYLPGLRKLCDDRGALLILDEIQTGMGRTGRLWAYEHWGVEPDIMTLAKALANGVPIGAMLAREDVEGDKRLVAYVVPAEGASVDVSSLREGLSKDLAEYMVPSAFVSPPARSSWNDVKMTLASAVPSTRSWPRRMGSAGFVTSMPPCTSRMLFCILTMIRPGLPARV